MRGRREEHFELCLAAPRFLFAHFFSLEKNPEKNQKIKNSGGAVVCLGPAGRNIAAGMTGGLAYFYDVDGSLPDKVNGEIVSVQRVCSAAGAAALRKLIGDHVERTGSKLGSEILGDWDRALPRFWQLVPPSEANTPEASPDSDGVSVAAAAGVPAAA